MRYQLGQTVNASVDIVDGDGNPAYPDTTPVATISGPTGFESFSAKMAIDGTPYRFYIKLYLGVPFQSLGTYTVTFSYLVDGDPITSTYEFDVIAGGDPGGRVISMHAYERPEARYVVAQLSSGLMLQGRNPRL